MRVAGIVVLAAGLIFMSALPGHADAAPTLKAAGSASAKSTLEAATRTQSAAILDGLQADGDFTAAGAKAAALFDRVIAQAGDKQFDALREASYTVRLIASIGAAPKAGRLDLLKYLRANDELAQMLAFMLGPGNRPADVFALLNKFREARAEQV